MRLVVATVVALLCWFGLAASALAVSVNGPPGQVLVRTVDGFTPINTLTTVEPGVQIAVLPGSLAHISYNNQCLVVLGPGKVWAVPNTSPCAPGQWVLDLSKPPPAPPAPPPLAGAPPTAGGTTGLLIAGSVAAGAGIFLATQAGDKSKKPASP